MGVGVVRLEEGLNRMMVTERIEEDFVRKNLGPHGFWEMGEDRGGPRSLAVT